MGKRLIKALCLLAGLALVCLLGQRELAAEFVEQESWHLIRAEAVLEGIEVEIAGKNLMLLSGVRVKADSEENRTFSAAKVKDGIHDDAQLRWSSENDWENNEHWLEVSFGQNVKIGLVRIYWERTNASAYVLEYSSDGKSWETAASFSERPENTRQDIYLENQVEAAYLRLRVTDVAKEEADLSLYYQNVSLLELEVYEGIEDAFLIRKPEIPAGSRRQLLLPDVPKGYGLAFVGADYENLVDVEGRIADTIGNVQAELGFALVRDGVSRELPGMVTEIPASVGQESVGTEIPASVGQESVGTEIMASVGQESRGAELPADFSVMEWKPGDESLLLAEELTVVFAEGQDEDLSAAARLFAQELTDLLGRTVSVYSQERSNLSGKMAAVYSQELSEDSTAAAEQISENQSGMIYLTLDCREQESEDWFTGVSDEGYEISLQKDGIWICAQTLQGLRWGCVTFLDLMEQTNGELPTGLIRDYPRYSVRGFGIDVGRRAVSLELLYRIVEAMSKEKMNTLQIHLNDNQIIAQSDYDGTEAGARSLYAGFRLESDLQNEVGEGITSEDLFYTKEEFAQLIADAAVYGVEIVPEIDTPAHSLAITNVFPKLGLSGNPESVDQLDLSNPEATELGKSLWTEYLTADGESGSAVFDGCSAVHIGMDEYFGDEKKYISYLEAISAHVKELAPDKEIRIWGSLSKIEADHSDVSKDIQMHIWDTDWADPEDMYEEGFSIINSLSSSLYIIPGGGYDWLDMEFLEESWQPNIFQTQERTWELPAYSPQMLGAVYMMWNDWSHQNGEEITEADLFDRFAEPLGTLAAKLWGSTQ